MSQTGIIEEQETEATESTGFYPMWKVIIHNDPVTTMQFVVKILMVIFHHTQARADIIMREAHHKNMALVNVYTKEVAELKLDQAKSMSGAENSPLTFTIEPAD